MSHYTKADALRMIAGYMDHFGLHVTSLTAYAGRVEVLVPLDDLMNWRSALDLCDQPEWVSVEADTPWSHPVWDDAAYGDLPFRITCVRYDTERVTS